MGGDICIRTFVVNNPDCVLSVNLRSYTVSLLRQTSVGIHQMSDASQVVPTNIVNFPLNTLFYVNYWRRIGISVDI